jgi:hypothetical protein
VVLAAALSTAHKLGLGLSGLLFVTFALTSAVAIPHWRPEFPGRRVGVFTLVAFLFFAEMMTAVVVFGKA